MLTDKFKLDYKLTGKVSSCENCKNNDYCYDEYGIEYNKIFYVSYEKNNIVAVCNGFEE